MPSIINLTPAQPVAVVLSAGAATSMALYDAVDIGQFDVLDLELTIVQAVTSVTPTLLTGMQTQNEDGWLAPLSSGWTISTATSQLKTFDKGLLRYLRWTVPAGTGTIIFYIRGMARRYGTP